MSLADEIRARLDDPIDVALNGTPYVDAIRAVLDEHPPRRIYDECGHTHTEGEPGTVTVDEVGVVCEAGYQYTICRGCCCTDDWEQTGWCGAEHRRDLLPCWPCTTVRVTARALGVETPAGAR
jgi:hypothetical protein